MSISNDRRAAREIALQISFQWEFNDQLNLTEALDYFCSTTKVSEGTRKYAHFLLFGLKEHLAELDSTIENCSAHWKLSRMASVDKNILRVGTFEIVFGQTEVPPKTAINEAIEIAKKYGSTDSSAFINGLLDEILKRS